MSPTAHYRVHSFRSDLGTDLVNVPDLAFCRHQKETEQTTHAKLGKRRYLGHHNTHRTQPWDCSIAESSRSTLHTREAVLRLLCSHALSFLLWTPGFHRATLPIPVWRVTRRARARRFCRPGPPFMTTAETKELFKGLSHGLE